MSFGSNFGTGKGWFSKIGKGGEGFMGKFGTGEGAIANMFPKRQGNNTTTNQFGVDTGQYGDTYDSDAFPGIDFGPQTEEDSEASEMNLLNLVDNTGGGGDDVTDVVKSIQEGDKGEAINTAQGIMDDEDEEGKKKGGFMSGLGGSFSDIGKSLMASGGNFQYDNIFGD